MIEEKQDSEEVMYQLVAEDVQLEALELIGRRLDDDELHQVKHLLSEFIHWDFYVREAINQIVKSKDMESENPKKVLSRRRLKMKGIRKEILLKNLIMKDK